MCVDQDSAMREVAGLSIDCIPDTVTSRGRVLLICPRGVFPSPTLPTTIWLISFNDVHFGFPANLRTRFLIQLAAVLQV